MNNSSLKDIGADIKFAKLVAKSAIHSFFRDGYITESDLKDTSAFIKKIKSLLKNKGFEIVVDHTENILSAAKNYAKKNEYEYSKIFYVLYFEHSTNGFINSECIKRSITSKSKNEILRLNLIDKLTWLLEIFNLPKYKNTNLKILKKLADERNAFIHYKYKSEKANTSVEIEKENQEQKRLINDIEKCIKYHNYYLSYSLYKGKKNRLDRLLK